MPVDKFGRRRVKNVASSDVSVTDIFLRRDGTNTITGTVSVSGNTFTNVSNPVNDHDAANKIYVDQNSGVSKRGDTMQGELNMNNFGITGLPASVPNTGSDAVSWAHAVQLVRDSEVYCSLKVNKAGDTMTGDLILSAIGDTSLTFGCSYLSLQRTFSILLGTSTNRLYFTNRQNPVVFKTDHGLLIRATQQRICQLGPSEIIIDKNVCMNNKRITSLMSPEYPHEAANKLYVDEKARKILQGYVLNLRSISTTRAPNDKFGFVVTTTSYLGNHYMPINAFNDTYSSGTGAGGEWVSNSETRNFWIQIKCPDIVRLWRIALRGRDSNTNRIYHWRLEGSTDGESFTTVFEPPNPTYLGNEVRNFPITTRHRFNIFRLFCIEAEPTNPSLSYMQLYVYSE